MTKPDVDFTKSGVIRLLPLDTTSFFLPFGRPVNDYIRGVAGRDNGMRRLARQEALDFPFEICWRHSTVEGYVPDGAGPDQEPIQASPPPEEMEPAAAGFLETAHGPAPRSGLTGNEGQRVHVEISGLRVVLPEVDALPLRPRITLAPPPAKLAKAPAAKPSSGAKPVKAAPAPLAPAAKPVPVGKGPVESPKPAPPETAKKAANVVEMGRRPSWSTAERSWSEEAIPENTTSEKAVPEKALEEKALEEKALEEKALPEKVAGEKSPGETVVSDKAASGKSENATASTLPVEIAKQSPLTVPDKKAPPTAAEPLKHASGKVAIIPAKPAPAPGAAKAKPVVVQTAPSAIQAKPAAVQAKPEAVQTKPEAAQTKPEAVQTKPVDVQAKPEETHAAKPEFPQPEPDEVRVPSFGGAGRFSSAAAAGAGLEDGFLARIPLAVKIGLVSVVLGLGGYFMVGGLRTTSTQASGRVPTSATVAGDQGWSTKDASDTVGVRRGRQMQFFDASASLADYKFEFVGTVETKALGWFFRARDTRNYYGMKIEFIRPGSAVLTHFAVVDGRESSYNQRPLGINASPGAPIPVRLEVAGARFTVAVQGQTVEVWTDNRLSRGAVGLMNERDEFGRAGNVRLSVADGR